MPTPTGQQAIFPFREDNACLMWDGGDTGISTRTETDGKERTVILVTRLINGIKDRRLRKRVIANRIKTTGA